MTTFNKKELRLKIKALKEQQNESDYFTRSLQIMQSVEELPVFRQASTVMLYWSIMGEVHTHDFIRKWEGRKRMILPSVEGDSMNLKLYRGERQLVPGDLYRIPEPQGPKFNDTESIDLIIVPGIAFDRDCNRMGRGKAYYDRFLRTMKAYKVGICFSFQFFDEIPRDENDIRMDLVITA